MAQVITNSKNPFDFSCHYLNIAQQENSMFVGVTFIYSPKLDQNVYISEVMNYSFIYSAKLDQNV